MSQMRRQTAPAQGFQEGPLPVGASPENTTTRPATHTRATSFFSFRNRTSSIPQASPNQNPGQQPLDGATPDDFGVRPPMSQSQSSNTQPPQRQQEEAPPRRSMSIGNGAVPPTPLHPEISSVVKLSLAHAQKVYYSGPLIRRVERQADGNRPANDAGWRDVWGQLGGTTLSVWDMKEIEEASKRGAEVPPTYVNITDAVRILLRWPHIRSMLMFHLVRSSFGLCHDTRNTNDATEEIHQRGHAQHSWIQPFTVFLSVDGGPHLVGGIPPPRLMGEIASGGDLHCPPPKDVYERERYLCVFAEMHSMGTANL